MCNNCEQTNLINQTCFECEEITKWMPSGCGNTSLSKPFMKTDGEIWLAPEITVKPFGFLMLTGKKLTRQPGVTNSCMHPIGISMCGSCGTTVSYPSVPIMECSGEVEIVMYCTADYRVEGGQTYPVLSNLVRGINPFNCEFLQGEAKYYKDHELDEQVIINDSRIPKYNCMTAYCLELAMCKINKSI